MINQKNYYNKNTADFPQTLTLMMIAINSGFVSLDFTNRHFGSMADFFDAIELIFNELL